MNALVYSVALGDNHWNQATLMVRALREFGNFGGEIRIYTERDSRMDGAKVVRCRDLTALAFPQLGKAFIGKTLNTMFFDRIVWMDTDVVTIKDCAHIFELDGLRVAGERIVTEEHQIASFSPPEFQCPIGTFGVNTGLLIAEAHLWNGMCQTWWNSLMDFKAWKRTHRFGDQVVFNHLWRHGAIRAEALPIGTMHFLAHGAVFNETTTFVHTREPKWEMMQCLVGMLENL